MANKSETDRQGRYIHLERRINRLQNLLMIPVTMYLIRYTVILPVIKSYGINFQLNNITFLCLSLSLICMSAAGYAISDYLDKPQNSSSTLPAGKEGDVRPIVTYIILCITGISLGGYVTWKTEMLNLIFVYIVVSVVLWLYSAIYKRQILTGNIIIAMLTALIPISVLLDIPPLYSFYGQFVFNLNFAVYWIIGVAVFIFLTEFLRNIIKDLEEFESDDDYDWKTLPFVMGDRFTKQTIISINTAIIAILCFVYFRYEIFLAQSSNYFSLFYFLFLLVIPLLLISWTIYKASAGADYRRAGNIMKLVMVAGVAYSGFFL